MLLPRRPLGRCSFLFLLAVSFDVLGLGLILVGVFAELQLDGRSFGEFLIYGGGIVLFFSLLWWLAWYALNLEVPLEELSREPPGSPVRRNLVQLARKVTESFSKRSRRKAGGAVPTTAALSLTTAAVSPTTADFSPTTAAVSPTTAAVSPTTLSPTTADFSPTTAAVSPTTLSPTTAAVSPTTAALSPTTFSPTLELSAAPCRKVNENFSKRSRRKAEGAVLSPTRALELSPAPCREVGSGAGGQGMADRMV
ncbi:transmembrane protein 238-like isoform X2 [Bufo bufo]|uniref:transmembrane protein 238-like isoform X2 n=1 Tax=Bufo bufo TaxID=8384 RepID=UPI001ABDC67E|nr:transmembrane protein 238-like isoform X2 [Bufo bufo]